MPLLDKKPFYSDDSGEDKSNNKDTTLGSVENQKENISRSQTEAEENVIDVYSRGFTNGVYQIEPDKDVFEGFLQASCELDRVTEEHQDNQKRIVDLKERFKEEKEAYKIAYETINEKESFVENLKLKITEIEQYKRKLVRQESDLIEKRNGTIAEYAWLPALLYLLAGIVFIIGDISITHQITSWGFDMAGMEGWVFAIGLAFTAFLIKPFIDRLFEKSYQKGSFELSRIFLVGIIFTACDSCNSANGGSATKVIKNKLVIIIDKSKSVTYSGKIDKVKSELKRQFATTYNNSSANTQLCTFTINADTKVIPEFARFDERCPYLNPESRSQKEALENWNVHRERWLAAQRKKIEQDIIQQPTSSKTDIFGIFDGLEQVQKVDGPWDTLKVLIFSDMIHTLGKTNMMNLTAATAFESGKRACQSRLMVKGDRKCNPNNLFLTIYTPDNMQNSGVVTSFWKGFFSEWGLPPSHYHFE